MNWPKQISGLPQVFDREFEEQRLTRLACLQFLLDGVVIVVTVLDGVIEDRGVLGESRDRELLDVTAECAAGQQTTGDIVEPEALTYFVQFLGRSHHLSPISPRKNGAALGDLCRRGGLRLLVIANAFDRRAFIAKLPVSPAPGP